MQVERHSPALSLRLFESEHQDGQGFHREAPSHAKSVRFPEQVNISPANDDRGQLEGDNEIDEAIRSSVLGVRLSKPIRQYAVFYHAGQHAVRANDRSVDGTGENKSSDQHKHETQA